MGKGQGVTPTVFISYSHANVQRVRTIAQRLRGWGYAVWLDEVALDPGDDWRARIEEAIPSADFLLLALTRSSVRSEMVEWELGLAAKTGVPVIPLDFGTGRMSFGNFSRTWYANSPRSRALIAGDVMRAFLEVYRHPPAERLKLELQVQD